MNAGSPVGTVKDPAEAARVIRRCNEHDGAITMLGAPGGEDFAFLFAAAGVPRDLLDSLNTQQVKLIRGGPSAIVIGKTAADELLIGGGGRIVEHRNAAGDAGVDQVGCLQSAGTLSVNGHDDDIGWRSGIRRNNQQMAGGAQDGSPAARDGGNEKHQQDRTGEKPAPKPKSHAAGAVNLADSRHFALGEVVFDGGGEFPQSLLSGLQLRPWL